MTSLIYLASSSPRRQELLRQVGIAFVPLVPQVDEALRAGEAAPDYVLRLARAKAHAGLERMCTQGLAAAPVLGADTSVVLDGRVLGKPRDRAEGEAMLQSLAGRTHQVLTAICVCAGAQVQTALRISEVSFAPLDAAAIAAYWASGEPCDKAGAYAIQGRAAGFIVGLHGSYSGVVGLPLYETVQALRAIGFNA